MEKYGKEQKAEMLKKVRDRQKEAHERARRLLEDMGYSIEKDIGHISNKPWDFIAKKHGLTFYVDAKIPFTKRGKFTISMSEMKGMRELRANGVPAYLFILPDGKNMLFTAT